MIVKSTLPVSLYMYEVFLAYSLLIFRCTVSGCTSKNPNYLNRSLIREIGAVYPRSFAVGVLDGPLRDTAPEIRDDSVYIERSYAYLGDICFSALNPNYLKWQCGVPGARKKGKRLQLMPGYRGRVPCVPFCPRRRCLGLQHNLRDACTQPLE